MREILHKTVWIVKQRVPRSWVRAVRAAKRKMSGAKREAARTHIRPVTRTELTEALRNAGIRQGDVLFVHSSLSRIGNVEGGAQCVVAALIDAVGENGTLIMPTYASADDYVETLSRGEVVDLRTARSVTGQITEVFRNLPGALRSSHPFSSCAAWGKHARYIVSDHHRDPRIFHEGSPIARFIELDGTLIGLGTGFGTISMYHCAEDLRSDFSLRTYGEPFLGTYIDAEGNYVQRLLVRHDPAVSKYRIDYPLGEWIREQLREHFEQRGLVTRFEFGCADSWVMQARALFDEVVGLAGAGVTIYSRPSEKTVETLRRLRQRKGADGNGRFSRSAFAAHRRS
jgi:aminoglycoside 3-N-acetyltransferase